MQPTFWMVLGSGSPTRRHTSLAEARSEAERLARLNPRCEFVILQSLATCKVSDIDWQKHEGTDDIPF